MSLGRKAFVYKLIGLLDVQGVKEPNNLHSAVLIASTWSRISMQRRNLGRYFRPNLLSQPVFRRSIRDI